MKIIRIRSNLPGLSPIKRQIKWKTGGWEWNQ